MAQLVIVVLAIVLTAIVVAGGSNYLSADIGVRTDTAHRVSTTVHVLETAFRSYRIANKGALPTPGILSELPELEQPWRSELASYTPSGGIDTPLRMVWDYIETSDETSTHRILCLHGAGITKAQHDGLVSVSRQLPQTMLTKSCLDDAADPAFDGFAALIVPLRNTN